MVGEPVPGSAAARRDAVWALRSFCEMFTSFSFRKRVRPMPGAGTVFYGMRAALLDRHVAMRRDALDAGPQGVRFWLALTGR